MKRTAFFVLVLFLSTVSLLPAVENKSISVGGQVITSTNRGTVFTNAYFNYGPSVMKVSSTLYRMCYTGFTPGAPNQLLSSIWLTESSNGFNWSAGALVLRNGVIPDIADPSVVKVGATYYMYMGGTLRVPPDPCAGTDTEIYLASSSDGGNWTMYPSNLAPQPVVPNSYKNCTYGVGQPSVAYRNGRFEMFFTDTSFPNGVGTYFATSTTGLTWTRQNNGRPVLPNVTGVDGKYCAALGRYILFRGTDGPKIFAHVSANGLSWDPPDSSQQTKFLHQNSQHPDWKKVQPGVIADPVGGIEANTAVLYGTGPGQPATWNYIERVDVSIAPYVSNAAYRYYSELAKDHFYTQDANSPDYYRSEGIGFRIFTSQASGTLPFHVLYKPDIKKHMYTASQEEKNYLISLGWV